MMFNKKRENFIEAFIMLLRGFAINNDIFSDIKSTFDTWQDGWKNLLELTQSGWQSIRHALVLEYTIMNNKCS